MANSPLDFPSTESFRNRLIVKNLKPYPKSPRRTEPPTTYPIIQSDYAVVDSPDNLIDEPTFANTLYPLNQYGQEGGYTNVADPNRLQNTKSNEGEYGYQDGDLLDKSRDTVLTQRPLNPYGNGTDIIDSAVEFSNLNTILTNFSGQFNAQPYPTTFVASFYGAASILSSPNPRGNNGSLSQDSFIAKLGAQILKKEFEERIAREIKQKTIGRANFLNVDDGTTALDLLIGRIPLIEPNYQITVPSNPITNVSDLALRLAGTLIPVSLIPGSYFDESINPGRPTTTAQIQRAYNTPNSQGVLSSLLTPTQSGSQLFINNTGVGQKVRLFGSLDFNKFKPSYERNIFQRIGGALTSRSEDNGEFYIGSRNSEPSRILSPTGELPIDEFNREVQAPVYGPSELAKSYEGEVSKQIKLGANGPTYSNGGGVEGGMTWVSPKYKDNAGFKVGPGGEAYSQDPSFQSYSFNSSESTNLVFKQGSILDETQRLINSQPDGAKRLQHVGNAIDQVSKVFNDGYVEMTKGSRVLAYVGEIGQEVGTEYCRVFAKDIPYLNYRNLQKTEGMTTEGRKFSFSVLDKTYNLNMYPNRREGGQDSTNLVGGPDRGYAKKYMFSLENLAWRTSTRPGYTVADLPMCERGPNGGRVMWFPPYDLKFTESVSVNFKGTDFIGRPEPVYTYNNTSRSGTLSWKIVVDHPSVLNVIVNKVLSNETNKVRVDSILESFFSNCRKYDLYELAKKYYTFNRNDLFEIQKQLEEVGKKDVEKTRYLKQTVTTNVDAIPAELGLPEPIKPDLSSYQLSTAFFENDVPSKNSPVSEYGTLYSSYYTPQNKTTYEKKSKGLATTNFFDNSVKGNFEKLEKFKQELKNLLSSTKVGKVSFKINSSCSAPASKQYNILLSERRIESLRKYFEEDASLQEFVSNKRLLITNGSAFGEGTTSASVPTIENGQESISQPFNCSDESGDNRAPKNDVYSVRAMACRRAFVTDIVAYDFESEPREKIIIKPEVPASQTTTVVEVPEKYFESEPVEAIVEREVVRDNISKRILRNLLTECDYFETIKEDSPMVYDSLRDKLKFFNPAFHSTTPEGLNSRLTFLQQCMRPGETIPVVQKDGTLRTNDAINTSFGAPPVLVLRVGDFFHSKIIPDGLQLSYDGPLDMNSEGIGLQPMIATVSFSFKFVGGQGLASAVDKLQNALTFNYYANTEIFDDRSDVTDDSYKVFDKQFLDYYNVAPNPPKIDNPEQTSKINQTIGTVTSATTTSTGTTGEINYQSFMKEMIEYTQTYFTNVLNKNKEVLKQYNNAVRQNWANERNYVNGFFELNKTKDVKLFGKPKNIEKIFQKVTDDFIDDIKNEDEGFIKFIKGDISKPKNFSQKVIRTLKSNYVSYIKNKSLTYQSALTVITQDFIKIQQNLINNIGKNNLVLFGTPNQSGTDGFKQSTGFITIYKTEPTTKVYDKTYTDTLQEIYGDTSKIIDDLQNFYTACTVQNLGSSLIYEDTKMNELRIFYPNSTNQKFTDIKLQRSYFLLSQDVTDDKKYESFKKALIGNIISNPQEFKGSDLELEKEFDGYWKNELKPLFTEENNLTTLDIDNYEKEKSNFFIYTPFNGAKLKKYEFTFTTNAESGINEDREFLIQAIGYSDNKFKTTNKWADLNSNPQRMICKVKLG